MFEVSVREEITLVNMKKYTSVEKKNDYEDDISVA